MLYRVFALRAGGYSGVEIDRCDAWVGKLTDTVPGEPWWELLARTRDGRWIAGREPAWWRGMVPHHAVLLRELAPEDAQRWFQFNDRPADDIGTPDAGPTECREESPTIVPVVGLEGEWFADTNGVTWWPLDKAAKGKWLRGPSGGLIPHHVVRTMDGAWLLRCARIELVRGMGAFQDPVAIPSNEFHYFQITPEQAAQWIFRAGFRVPADLATAVKSAPKNGGRTKKVGASSADSRGVSPGDLLRVKQLQDELIAKQEAARTPSLPTDGTDPPAGVGPIGPGRQSPVHEAVRGNPPPKVQTAENRALAIALDFVREGNSLSIAEIARQAGCSRVYLYRCEKFMAFLKSAERRGDPARGQKNRGTGDVEAWRKQDSDEE